MKHRKYTKEARSRDELVRVNVEGKCYLISEYNRDQKTIVSGKTHIKLFTVCTIQGWDYLPEIPPYEIRKITFDEPDITDKYLSECRKDFEKWKKDLESLSDDEFAKKRGMSAKDPKVLQQMVADGRQKVLEMKFEEYRKYIGRRDIWRKYATLKMIEDIGYRSKEKIYQQCRLSNGAPDIDKIKYEALFEDDDIPIVYLKNYKVLHYATPESGSKNKTLWPTNGIFEPKIDLKSGEWKGVFYDEKYYPLGNRKRIIKLYRFLGERKKPAFSPDSAVQLPKNFKNNPHSFFRSGESWRKDNNGKDYSEKTSSGRMIEELGKLSIYSAGNRKWYIRMFRT